MFELRELQTNQLKAERTPQVQVPQSGYRRTNAINERDMLWVIQIEKNRIKRFTTNSWHGGPYSIANFCRAGT
mgnify:CR=1 FL=1